MQKSLSEMMKDFRNAIAANIPETYTVKPMFEIIADEESIRNGVLAFRDFLYRLCDRVIADGSVYDRPPKESKHDRSSWAICYPFMHNVKSILFNMGYYGQLTEKGDLILLGSNIEPLTDSILIGNWKSRAKITAPKLVESLKFLAQCGLYFDGIDLNAKKPDISKVESLEISYRDNPAMLTGMKVMAVAQKELYTPGNHDIFFRCNYRVLKEEETDVTSLLKDFLNPLPAELQDFALKLHRRYTDAGLTCSTANGLRFFYYNKKKEIWSFNGHRIQIKAQNTEKYADVIKDFASPLQEKIAEGYGCEKKRYGKPCQHGCHGFSFPLDESMLDMSGDIEAWLDNELVCVQKRGNSNE